MKSLLKFFSKQTFLTCLLLASSVLLIKIYAIPESIEFIEPTSIYTALLSSLIFIYWFMIAPAVSEYKESERIRVELKSVIQNILSDIDYFSMLRTGLDKQVFLRPFAKILENVFFHIADNKAIPPLYKLILELNMYLFQSETSGIPANHIIKVRQEIGNFRRLVTRLIQIKENDSLPKVVHNLKNFITLFIITTLLFLNIWSSVTNNILFEVKEWIIIFLLSFIYLYLSSIITSLENPFDKRRFLWYIDVSYLRKISETISLI